jgi:NSS family neurotransmitter:Na+ symporter
MAAAGSAVGLGNIWSFPYLAGKHGGAAFLMLYISCVVLVGLPVMLTELIIGRRAEKNPVGAYAALKPGTRWFLLGGIGVAAGFLILSFYSVVAGWVLGYFVESLTGTLSRLDTPALSTYFDGFAANPWKAMGYHFAFMGLCVMIVIQGVKGGIERWSKILMPVLFLLLVVLVLRGLTLPGSLRGASFLFAPDFSKLNAETFMAALGQACFTLSIGMGAMITYGSYMSRRHNLASATLQVSAMDTFIALMAGMAIFPAVFAVGLEPGDGPGLLFKTLPAVFNQMPGGAVFAPLFFFLVLIAALTSGISLMEVVTAYMVDERGMSRRMAAVVFGGVIFLLGIPSALSSGASEFFTHFTSRAGALVGLGTGTGAGMSFFDLAYHISADYMLPVGAFLCCIFIGWAVGKRIALSEVHDGNQTFVTGPIWFILVRYLTPFLVGQILLFGILGEFEAEAVQSFSRTLMSLLVKFDVLLAGLFFLVSAWYLVIGRNRGRA